MKKQLYVGAYSKNPNAQKLYINNGFKTVSQEVQEETGEMVINKVLELALKNDKSYHLRW